MKNYALILSFFYTWVCFGQEETQPDYQAMEESKKLTCVAGKEFASDYFISAEATLRKAISICAVNPAAPYNLVNAYYEKEIFGVAFGRF